MTLDKFIASPPYLRNEWLAEPGLAYYVRKSVFLPGVIELASCGAVDDGTGTVGALWKFLRRYEARVPFYMEQVLNPALAAHMRRRGWRERRVADVPQFASPLMCRQYATEPRFLMWFSGVLVDA